MIFLFLPIILTAYVVSATRIPVTRSNAQCEPFSTNFSSTSIRPWHLTSGNEPFVALSPENDYSATGSGLELLIRKPNGDVIEKDGVNSAVADGATINSTFTVFYGKVSFEVSAPLVPGFVTAAILIADTHDEIDIELLGGDPDHWQTNVYGPSKAGAQPLWGVFGEIENLPKSSNVEAFHTYTIDWNEERISWSVDGALTRSLTSEQTIKDGIKNYPSHPARIQLGIWDGSSPQGTAQWAKGPVNWAHAPATSKAVIRSITVECPYS